MSTYNQFASYARLLAKNESFAELAQRLARSVLDRVEPEGVTVPVDPYRVATQLGLEYEFRDLAFEGILIPSRSGEQVGFRREAARNAEWDRAESDGRARILLRAPDGRTESRRRVRFTAAHEVGHFVLREAVTREMPMARFGEDDRTEEVLCNLFAAELLMPAELVRQRTGEGTKVTPQSVLDMASTFDVSLQAMCRRLSDVHHREVGFAIWSTATGVEFVEWSTHRSFFRLRLLHPAQSTVGQAFLTDVEPGEMVREYAGVDECSRDGRHCEVHCSSALLGRSGKVLSVIDRRYRGEQRP